MSAEARPRGNDALRRIYGLWWLQEVFFGPRGGSPILEVGTVLASSASGGSWQTGECNCGVVTVVTCVEVPVQVAGAASRATEPHHISVSLAVFAFLLETSSDIGGWREGDRNACHWLHLAYVVQVGGCM